MYKRETEEDVLNEEKAYKYVRHFTGAIVHKFPKEFSVADFYTGSEDSPTAIFEHKTREIYDHEYPNLFLAVQKYIDLMKLSRKHDNIPVYHTYMTKESIRIIRIDNIDMLERYEVTTESFYNRHNLLQTEDMFNVPQKDMKLLCQWIPLDSNFSLASN